MALWVWIIGITTVVALITWRTHSLSSDLRQRRDERLAEDLHYWYPELNSF